MKLTRPLIRPAITRPAPAVVIQKSATIAPQPAPVRRVGLLARPHNHSDRQALHTAFSLCKAGVSRMPLALNSYVEKRDDFQRLYALVIGKDTALCDAHSVLAPHSEKLWEKGVRLCLYVAGGDDLIQVLRGIGKPYCWIACGKQNMFLLYPRCAALTKEWALETYNKINQNPKSELYEKGLTIEFPTE